MRIVFLICTVILSLAAIASVGDFPKFFTFTIAAAIGFTAFLFERKSK